MCFGVLIYDLLFLYTNDYISIFGQKLKLLCKSEEISSEVVSNQTDLLFIQETL